MGQPAPTVRRIMIIGGPGSGRSRLARSIAQKTGLPQVDLNGLSTAQVGEGGLDPMTEAARAERWILVGNHPQSWPYRSRRADLILFLDLPLRARLRCLFWRRFWGRHGETHISDAAARAYEHIERPQAVALITRCQARRQPRCVVLRSAKAVDWFDRNFAQHFRHVG